MTSIFILTCNNCDRLPTSSAPLLRRPRIAIAMTNNGRRVLRPSLRTIATRARAIFGTRGGGAPASRPTPSPDHTNTPPGLLARALGHPDGVGFIGPGADALLRAVFTEALTIDNEVAQVITTKTDLDRLFAGAFDQSLINAHSPRLCIVDGLEDAIEHLEAEAEMAKMISATCVPTTDTPAIIWFAAPGPHADIVHTALRHWADASLLAFISGPWPYGPTHLIEETGPRPLPSTPLPLPSPQEAIERLPTRRPG
ncbi:hypothetical protein [Actinomadura geliboluensis]|uniref:hypothetical protein n=1 Tax=Actinomadura geliboluensis TaxID=882440 RepID=UPI00367E67DC